MIFGCYLPAQAGNTLRVYPDKGPPSLPLALKGENWARGRAKGKKAACLRRQAATAVNALKSQITLIYSKLHYISIIVAQIITLITLNPH